ncbi:hypothetical protein [Halorientalis sp.]|uniref:hypothetical protein n=1 Tax=Halorientalis sp. TaxID=1931229 RepID=UPI002636D801|nr:hypothetical protein [Halorientalis sp.]
MHGTVRRPALQSPDPPDTVFSLVAGLYLTLLVSPAVVVATAVAMPLGAAGLYVALLTVLTAVAAAVTVGVGRVPGVAERIGASPFARGLVVPPVVCAAGYLFAASNIETAGADGAALVGVVFAVVGVVVGLALVAMSRTRYATAVVDDERVSAEWTAGWPRPLRVWLQAGGTTLYFGGTALLFGGEFVGLGAYEWLGALAFVPGGVAIGWGQPRAYRLSPVGIDRSNHVHRRLYEWDSFESFSVTDDAVILRRSGPRPSFRCWREEIDDEAALIDVLDDHLPRA